jgi:hypothetical protein
VRMTNERKNCFACINASGREVFKLVGLCPMPARAWNGRQHEVAEYSSGEPIDPKRGNVRLRLVPDETCSLEDLEGDCFNPKSQP